MLYYSVQFGIELNNNPTVFFSIQNIFSTHLCSLDLFLFPALKQDLSADLDSDHDYETINETLVSVVKKAQEDVMFY